MMISESGPTNLLAVFFLYLIPVHVMPVSLTLCRCLIRRLNFLNLILGRAAIFFLRSFYNAVAC